MSNYNSTFTSGIRQWIDLDIQIDQMNQKLRKMRESREVLGTKLANYMKQNQLTKTAFNVNDNRVVFRNESKYSNLSYDYLFKCCCNYFGDTQKAQQLCQYVKEQRQKTTTPSLRRSDNKPKPR